MSDEDFLNASPSDFKAEAPSEPESTPEEELDETLEDDVNSSSESTDEESDTDEEEEETSEEQDSEEQESSEDDESELESDEDEEELEQEPEEQSEYEKQLAEIMAPIKASGREIKLDSPEQVRKLVQMGVDYNNKMRGMKPHLKTLKMLENNGLMDTAKLSYLIDLDKKNPEAISKLLKESGINPVEIDTSEESKYTPSDHSVSDSEVDLDEVISRIQDTPTFSTTMHIVNNEWDDTSKRTLVGKPALIENLNTHMTNGTFDRVMSEVDKVRMFGGLSNLSDLEAYQQMGAMMQERGDFNVEKSTQTPAKKVSAKPKVEPDNDRKDKKRRASPSKKITSSKQDKEFDPIISLSDEEFIKKFTKN